MHNPLGNIDANMLIIKKKQQMNKILTRFYIMRFFQLKNINGKIFSSILKYIKDQDKEV